MIPLQLEVRVLSRTVEAEGICSFELAAPDGTPLPPFTAGAHIDVHPGEGLVRQYSLCNDPRETQRWRIAVLREPASRGGSKAMHERLSVGDLIRVGAPRNLFALEEGAAHSILLAGGIGVTPILAMAQRLHALGASFEMHYGARSRSRLAFGEQLAAGPFGDRVHVHLDDGDAAQKLDLAALLRTPAPGVHVYVCGPAGFLKAVLDTCERQGWPTAQVHHESFAANSAPEAGDRAFDVRIASTGKIYRIAADQPVTVALAAQGVEIPVSCEQGICGTCLTRVVDGVPDHRDQFLTDDERARGDQFTPCCSRATGPLLVLDL